MPMDPEERKLQIKLAKLQADIQIWLTVCFSFVALFGGSILGFEQLYYSTPADQVILRLSFQISMFISIGGLVGVAAVSTRKMIHYRNEMDKLK